MKLLLDESVPRQLRSRFPEDFETHTVPRMGWAGPDNGALLRLAGANGFDAFITADQRIEHQQNPDFLPLPVLILIAHRTRVIAIVDAARQLTELRDRWLNPPEWMEWVDEPVPGNPKRPVARDEAGARSLKKRTLTNL